MTRHLAILFDLDGTLIDLNPEPAELEQLRKTTLQLAASAGVSLDTNSILRAYERVVAEHGFDHTMSKRIRRTLDAYEIRWAQYRSVAKHRGRPLSRLRKRGCILGIVTSNGVACLRALCDANKLKLEWFDFSVTRDSCPLLKPSHAPLKCAYHLAERRSPRLSRVWFVGDSRGDQQAVEAFNRCPGLKVSFVGIGPTSQGVGRAPWYASVDDFLEELEEEMKQ